MLGSGARPEPRSVRSAHSSMSMSWASSAGVAQGAIRLERNAASAENMATARATQREDCPQEQELLARREGRMRDNRMSSLRRPGAWLTVKCHEAD
jgi:hypothetical protein